MYGLAAVVWFYALSITEVSTGYPVLVGLTFVLVSLGAACLFPESLAPAKLAGMVLILAGILLVSQEELAMAVGSIRFHLIRFNHEVKS